MMQKNFYRLVADPAAVSRWYLKSPVDRDGVEIDPRIFRVGSQVDVQIPLVLPLRRQGKEVDFNFCDFDMVVTPRELNEAIEALVGGAVQRIPISISGAAGNYEILNVRGLVSCIDEARSDFLKWTQVDGRPEKTGQYRMFARLRISPQRATGHHIFRLAEWPIALVVSEEMKKLFEFREVSGVAYERIS
jgi:hypothetical protein